MLKGIGSDLILVRACASRVKSTLLVYPSQSHIVYVYADWN